MSARQILGATVLLILAASGFFAMVKDGGFIEAAKAVGFSIAVTALIAASIWAIAAP